MHPLVRKNQELWDEWAEINYRSAFYDVAGFVGDPAHSPLDPEVLAGLGDLTGAKVLHLQCHFGMDTLRLARLAREVVGVDFSTRAIARARELAAHVGIAARFVECDLYTLPEVLDEHGSFDVVFTSYGVIGWLPDLARWGEVIARFLAPGGRFFLIEGHPTMWMFDDAAPDGALAITFPYFASGEALVLPPTVGNYADPTAMVTKTEYSWPHGIGEVVTALARAGLVIDTLDEHRHVVWRAFRCLVETSPNRFTMPADRPQLPLMFSIRAHRPGASASPSSVGVG
jgi:SAM-dependent methyltransferase